MRLVCVLVACLVALGGCGGDDVNKAVDQARAEVDQLRQSADEVRKDAERIGEKIRKRVSDSLKDIRKAVPSGSLPAPRRESQNAIERFLTETLRSIDTYWTRTLKKAGAPEPVIRYAWVKPGQVLRSGCGEPADQNAAFYCPADDTMYIGEKLADEIWRGVARNFPGQAAGVGRAIGDFGLAYVVAHEYGHNLQQEFGFFAANAGGVAKPLELQADCFAGTWGNAVYREGRISDQDVEEAISTAVAAGDFEFGNPQHHGTPEERRDAWLLGFTTGDPAECVRLVTPV